jgi:hypothetical protein
MGLICAPGMMLPAKGSANHHAGLGARSQRVVDGILRAAFEDALGETFRLYTALD